ncbi:hypothetical protein D2T29_20360 [Sinirhodobacter populi]|uniref:Uncharacterized protein n=1 Tax=Paenirhodobacter populi TaxID=2306993 RepID=A0A443K1B1_9RHOB|nr:hypothetical protein [Sinirhodobacter populi]RWR26540.1 hypothetical protein D2T29_20360 [Sinirhodobacter populi]
MIVAGLLWTKPQTTRTGSRRPRPGHAEMTRATSSVSILTKEHENRDGISGKQSTFCSTFSAYGLAGIRKKILAIEASLNRAADLKRCP